MSALYLAVYFPVYFFLRKLHFLVDVYWPVCYSFKAMEGRALFLLTSAKRRDSILFQDSEDIIMRTRITLACTECKNRNYDTTKDKKTHPDRMEMKKYCRFCKTHTMHKETK